MRKFYFGLRWSIVTLMFFSAGCAELARVKTVSDEPNLQVEWPKDVDGEAANLLEYCQNGFEHSAHLFLNLPVHEKNDMAFLKSVNELDISIDGVLAWTYLLAHVHPEKSVREIGELCEQAYMKLYSEYSLSQPIYHRLKAVSVHSLSAIDKRFVEKMLQDFQLSGVDKNATDRERIKKLNDELTIIGQEFSKNIREDTKRVELEPKDLHGLPEDYISAHPVNENGKVIITSAYPDYFPFMNYAKSDSAKKKLYTAFRNRGYPQNKEVLMKLLEKRFEYAQIMGFDSYASYVTSNKMIESPKNAWAFINKVNELAKAKAAQDNQILLKRLKQIQPQATLVQDWQKTYLESLVRNEQYQVDAQEVRQYFSYQNVRQGIFDLVQDLFGVRITPWETATWHESVESYEIWDGKQIIGQFYLDMHPREGKYNHAAAFSVREGVQGVQTPIKALVCNFPGGDGGEALLEHSQVETFLHEFGHLLHGIFSGQQPWITLSGISTERDFVEAPSQMLEEWVWHKDTLKTFAKNADGKVIPNELIQKMLDARQFGRGAQTRHQMYYAALALSYYDRPPESVDLDAISQSLQNTYSPYPYVEDTHMYASFGHLDGYSATYYTYMWSLMIASDMFSEFEKHGLRNVDVAQRYRDAILSAGGSKPAADLVRDFLGRDFQFDAFAKSLNVEE